ncbi:hypothetical protein V2J09_015542 [Rumex salicifolius]
MVLDSIGPSVRKNGDSDLVKPVSNTSPPPTPTISRSSSKPNPQTNPPSVNLSDWNHKVFGNIFRRKRNLWRQLERVQLRLSTHPTRVVIYMESMIKEKLETVLNQEQLLWFQKSRVGFLIDGDRNTKFYHLTTVIRRHANRILALQNDNGEWIYEPEALENLVQDYFARLFTDENLPPRAFEHPMQHSPFLDLSDELLNSLTTLSTNKDLLSMPSSEEFVYYLGVPMATGRMSRECYSVLLDKVSKRLQGWKARSLSLAGRVTLATSVLSSLSLYTMQTSYIPRIVCDDIDKMIKGFVWGTTSERRRVHLLSWDVHLLSWDKTEPKQNGDLGPCPMREINSATLAKLGWRLLQEPTSLWSRVIRSKYCNRRLDVDMFLRHSNSSQVWQGIVHGAQTLKKGLQSSIGNGNNTMFWNHAWVDHQPLSKFVTTPIPIDIADVTVAELWDGTSWRWPILSPLLPLAFTPSRL